MGRSHLADDPRVLLIIVVAVACNFGVGPVAICSIFSPRVPDTQSFAICVPTPFDLAQNYLRQATTLTILVNATYYLKC